MIKKISLLLLGIIIATIGNWPSVVQKYFPANLLLCTIGAVLIGCFGMILLLGDK